jgi:hypothetical protein
LEDYGYSTLVLDFSNEFSIAEIINILSKHLDNKTLWVGFSSTFYWPERVDNTGTSSTSDFTKEKYFTSDYDGVLSLIDYIRKNSNAKIIYGGAKSPYFAFLDNFDTESIDYYVIGNADNSIIDITHYLAGKKNKIEHLDNKIIDSRKYPEPDIKNIRTKL